MKWFETQPKLVEKFQEPIFLESKAFAPNGQTAKKVSETGLWSLLLTPEIFQWYFLPKQKKFRKDSHVKLHRNRNHTKNNSA